MWKPRKFLRSPITLKQAKIYVWIKQNSKYSTFDELIKRQILFEKQKSQFFFPVYEKSRFYRFYATNYACAVFGTTIFPPYSALYWDTYYSGIVNIAA